MRGLSIRTEMSAAELRAVARRDMRPRLAPRLYTIVHVLDGVSRAEAARSRLASKSGRSAIGMTELPAPSPGSQNQPAPGNISCVAISGPWY